MRKYRLELGAGQTIEFTPTWIEKLRRGDLTPVYRVVSGLAVAVLLAAGVLFPLLTGWARPEVGYATYLVVVVSVLIACLIVSCLLVGARRLSDPPMFMSSLLFVFMVLVALLFAPANQANTFGPVSAKYMGGLWVMLLLALFYMITMFINSGRRLRWARVSVMCGLMLGAVLLVLSGSSSSQLVPLTVLAVPVLALFALQLRRKVLSVMAAAMAIVALAWGYNLTIHPEMMLAVLLGLVMTALTLLAVNNWKIKFDSAKLRSELMLLAKRQLGIRTSGRANVLMVVSVGILIWLVVIIVWMLARHYPLGDMMSNIANDSVNAANSFKEIKTIIFGNGVVTAANVTLLGAVIRYEGVIGLFAYLLIAVSSFYLVLQNFTRDARVGGRFWWSLALGLIVFTIPIYGMLALPSMLLSVLWWSCVGLLAAKQLWDQQGVRLYDISNSLSVRGVVLDKYLPVIRAVLVVVVFGGWYYVLSVVAAMAAQGVI